MNHLIILVAEDDEADIFLLQRAFRTAEVRARVDFVGDGQAAVDYLSQHDMAPADRPMLALLDLKMPRMDGFEVLEWLAVHPECRPPLVVVFSSSSQHKDIERAASLGADHYLAKPSNAADLPGIVKRLEQYCLASAAAAHAF